MKSNNNSIKLGILGASFETGNNGVSALAESTVKCILNRWSDPEIIFIGSSRKVSISHTRIADKDIVIPNVPIRFSKNIFLRNHFFILSFLIFAARVIPSEYIRKKFAKWNRTYAHLFDIDMFFDITGGDSFSDIYGMKRFTMGFLTKSLMILTGKPFIMLPQTYGPFNKALSKIMAKHILKKADKAYSRDSDGVEYSKQLLKNNKKVSLCPDVAFVLDAKMPKQIDTDNYEGHCNEDTLVVGLNISALLYNRGYSENNMFNLKIDYRKLVIRIIEHILSFENTIVLLVPHVFPPEGNMFESDPEACNTIYEQLIEKYKGKLFLVRGKYDQSEIKYIIGKCNVFIGARMHSCIAAMSQGIPTVGLAYSKKFIGVFETIGMANNVADLRHQNEQEILAVISSLLNERKKIADYLSKTIPETQQKILSIFEEF